MHSCSTSTTCARLSSPPMQPSVGSNQSSNFNGYNFVFYYHQKIVQTCLAPNICGPYDTGNYNASASTPEIQVYDNGSSAAGCPGPRVTYVYYKCDPNVTTDTIINEYGAKLIKFAPCGIYGAGGSARVLAA